MSGTPYYPPFVLVTLVEIDETSCNNVHHRLEYQEESDPPEYREMQGEGDFAWVQLRQVQPSNLTWHLIIYNTAGICAGYWNLRRTVVADDPLGDYCRWIDSEFRCEKGKASVTDDT